MRLPAAVLQWGLLLSRPGVAHQPALLVGERPSPLQRAGGAAAADISLSAVFKGKESEGSCAGTDKGSQRPKPGWSSRCCCDGACWLALPCVAGSSSSLVLSSSARALGLVCVL